MLRYLVIIVIFLTVGLDIVFSQPENGSGSKKEDRVKMSPVGHLGKIVRDKNLRRSLSLSEEQRDQIKEILVAVRGKIQIIKKEAEEKINSINEDILNDIKPILTAEQQNILEHYLQEMETSSEFSPGLPGVSPANDEGMLKNPEEEEISEEIEE